MFRKVTNRPTVWMMVLELMLVLLWLRHVAWTPVKVYGAVLAVISMSLVIVARLQLGNSFSVRAKATVLVTKGLYSHIRNPIYLASGAFFLGVAMLLQSWLPVIALVIVIPIQLWRIRKEEQVLTERFGEEYIEYKRQTWF